MLELDKRTHLKVTSVVAKNRKSKDKQTFYIEFDVLTKRTFMSI